MIRQLFIAGASGDLATRYLIPALVALHDRDLLAPGFAVTGLARSDSDSERYRERILETVAERRPALAAAAREFVQAIEYRQADVTEFGDLRAALEVIDEPLAFYLAIPPQLLHTVLGHLAAIGLPNGSRVVIEKPFGTDLESARELNALLREAFPGPAAFRVDHFLAEQVVQNVLALRFANRVFEPLWNREHIERVEITWDETLALEGRAGYYDSAGALRDMVQNHLLQTMAVVAMDQPAQGLVGDAKLALLRSIPSLTPDEVDRRTLRARYTAGSINGREVPAYVDEDGVEGERGTETFVEVELRVDNDRWRDVPFVLRTGKALARDREELALHFRAPAPGLNGLEGPDGGQVLRIRTDSPGVTLSTYLRGPSEAWSVEERTLAGEAPPARWGAYAHVLLDVLNGESELSVDGEEAEEAWRIAQAILVAWEQGRSPLREYAAGSQGPAR